MTKMTVNYVGNLGCELTHEQSGTKIITDAPLDNGGKGESFSPTDLVASALAACALTIMAKKAETLEIPFRASVEVEKIMATNPRRIEEIVLNITFADTYDEKTRRILESTAHACPVAQSLQARQTLIFHWNS